MKKKAMRSELRRIKREQRADQVIADARRSVKPAGPASAVMITLSAAEVHALWLTLLERGDTDEQSARFYKALDRKGVSYDRWYEVFCKVSAAHDLTRRAP